MSGILYKNICTNRFKNCVLRNQPQICTAKVDQTGKECSFITARESSFTRTGELDSSFERLLENILKKTTKTSTAYLYAVALIEL